MDTKPPEVRELDPFEGHEAPSRARLSRALTRTRESAVTRSAWRMDVTWSRGGGAIYLVELDHGPCYRGEGVFLGWPQARLAAAYRRLLPPPESPEPDPGQFG